MFGFGSLDELLDRAEDDWVELEEAVKIAIRRQRDEHDDIAIRVANRLGKMLAQALRSRG